MSTISDRLKNLSPQQLKVLKEELKSFADHTGYLPEDQKGQRLVAYVVGKPGLNKSDLKTYLLQKIPDYMVPSEIVILDELPKLPNGKLDLNAMRNMEETLATKPKEQSATEYTPVQQKLVTIFEDVLGFSPIKLNDNFFEIGGDSILSIQITAKARNNGFKITPNQIFEYQSISELAEVIEVIEEKSALQTEKNSEELSGAEKEPAEQNNDIGGPNFPDAGLSQDNLNTILNQLD